MNKLLARIVVIMTMALASVSCLKIGIYFGENTINYKASWAAAYYLGMSPDGRNDIYELRVAAGKIDDEFNLAGPGGLVSLVISVPYDEEISYPAGRYNIIAEDSYLQSSSLLNLGEYVNEPIDSGTVNAKVVDGEFQIFITIFVGNREYNFEYIGELGTFDIQKSIAKI